MRPLNRVVAVALVVLGGLAAVPVPAGAGPARQPAYPRTVAVALWAAARTPTAPGTGAYVYDTDLVPPGSSFAVLSVSRRRTGTWLTAGGLLPNRTYGAHLHVRPCGALPGAAGPHYQRVADPVQPSTDPRYANPRNEVWLDLRTDAAGRGRAASVNPWAYRTPPASLVVHASATATDKGHAGTAGPRVACLTLARPR